MNNDTVIIIILGAMGTLSMIQGNMDFAANISAGLIGYLGGKMRIK